MDSVWNLMVKVSRAFACLGGVLLLLAAVMVSIEVVSRKLFTMVYSGSDELAAYLFAVGTTWSLAHVLVTRGHVRIDALYRHLPLRTRAALRTGRNLVRATYPGSRAIVRLHKETASIDLRGSLFCEVRAASVHPLCGFYAAAIAHVLHLFSIPAEARVDACRAAGGRRISR